MLDWSKLKKIDAHIHILPDCVHEMNPDSDPEESWTYAKIDDYIKIMDLFHIEKAIIMPLNDPYLMSTNFTISAVHKNLFDMKRRYPHRFYAFADIDPRNSPTTSVEALCGAISEYNLDGIKIHPNNTGIPLDSEYNDIIFSYAQSQKIPVTLHSYPNTQDDPSAAWRIYDILEKYPDLILIIAHMGGFQWEDLVSLPVFVDMSAILPDYSRKFGIANTNTLLRQFGSDRLIFATDYPDNRVLSPSEIYDSYFHILNRMDFTPEEVQKIAYDNIHKILENSKKQG